jgi:hypothetical protein
VWKRFLVGALNLDSPSRDESLFLLEVMKSFLRYGADTQCHIRCRLEDPPYEDIEGETVSEAIEKILHRHQLASTTDKSVSELLELLQSEIQNVEAHDTYCERILNATQDRHCNSFGNQRDSRIQILPSSATCEENAGPGYAKLNLIETPPGGSKDIEQMRQDSSFRQSQAPRGERRRVLGDPRVSKHPKVPPRSANFRVMVRVAHELAVKSSTSKLSEYHT